MRRCNRRSERGCFVNTPWTRPSGHRWSSSTVHGSISVPTPHSAHWSDSESAGMLLRCWHGCCPARSATLFTIGSRLIDIAGLANGQPVESRRRRKENASCSTDERVADRNPPRPTSRKSSRPFSAPSRSRRTHSPRESRGSAGARRPSRRESPQGWPRSPAGHESRSDRGRPSFYSRRRHPGTATAR